MKKYCLYLLKVLQSRSQRAFQALNLERPRGAFRGIRQRMS